MYILNRYTRWLQVFHDIKYVYVFGFWLDSKRSEVLK